MNYMEHDASAFQVVESDLGRDRPPVSILAVAALVAGIVSLLAPLSIVLILLPAIAIALGIVAVWKTSRDPAVGGMKLAQVGLGLGALSCAWGMTGLSRTNDYLTKLASQYAVEFLETLAAGNKYQALELTVPEYSRRTQGTDLEHYYSKLEGAQEKDVFLQSASVRLVMASGADARWEFSHRVNIEFQGNRQFVTVRMVNRQAPGQQVNVRLQRTVDDDAADAEDAKAYWNVASVDLP